MKKLKQTSFVKSFKNIKKSFFLVVILDILKIVAAVVVFMILTLTVYKDIQELGISPDMMDEVEQNKDDPDYQKTFMLERMQANPNFRGTAVNVLGNTLVYVLLAVLAFSGLLAMINMKQWNIITKSKGSTLKYLLLLLGFNIPAIGIFITLAFTLKPTAIAWIIPIYFVLYIYISIILYPTFVIKRKLLPTLKATLKKATKHAHYVIGNLLIIYIIYQLFATFFLIYKNAPASIYYILIGIILITTTWLKYFTLEMAKHEA
jgi:hypothetical protein